MLARRAFPRRRSSCFRAAMARPCGKPAFIGRDCRAPAQRVPGWRFDQSEAARLAEHIVAFSLHGLAAYAAPRAASAGRAAPAAPKRAPRAAKARR